MNQMPGSNRYKLLRHGSVRAHPTGAPRNRSRSGRYAESANILAPNLEKFGQQPFTGQDRQALAQRLQDPQWPRGTLNIYGLEGLLTALLVLPLGLRPGAWVPFIWNETGWKIPVALQGAEQYHEFIDSMVGLLRAIDNGLLETPPKFASTLDSIAAQYSPETLNPYQDWARGFGVAVSQSNYLKVLPDSSMHRALYVIASHAAPPTTGNHRHSQTSSLTLQQAVLALAQERTSLGPLGPLPAMHEPIRKTIKPDLKGSV